MVYAPLISPLNIIPFPVYTDQLFPVKNASIKFGTNEADIGLERSKELELIDKLIG